jgi:hypothetical protein
LRERLQRGDVHTSATSKWPALARIAPSFIIKKCFSVITSEQPVTVTKQSPSGAASSIGITQKPSMCASIARTGSTSVTMTFAPRPLARMATPLPHQP